MRAGSGPGLAGGLLWRRAVPRSREPRPEGGAPRSRPSAVPGNAPERARFTRAAPLPEGLGASRVPRSPSSAGFTCPGKFYPPRPDRSQLLVKRALNPKGCPAWGAVAETWIAIASRVAVRTSYPGCEAYPGRGSAQECERRDSQG